MVVVVALAIVACLGVASSTLGQHARPASASPATFRLVPAFEECFGSTTSTHGPPLTLASCNPVIQSSSYLTFNASERAAPYFGPANGSASLGLKVTCVAGTNPVVETGDTPPCNQVTGDQQDVKVTFSAVEVRCVGNPGPPAQALCAGGAGSAGAGTHYNGKMLIDLSMRVTDHYNALSPNPPATECSDTTTCTATVTDFPVPVATQCSNGNCGFTTTIDASIPFVGEGKRAVVELGQVQVQDAGANGNLIPESAPGTGVCPPSCAQDDASTVFLSQGVFAP